MMIDVWKDNNNIHYTKKLERVTTIDYHVTNTHWQSIKNNKLNNNNYIERKELNL